MGDTFDIGALSASYEAFTADLPEEAIVVRVEHFADLAGRENVLEEIQTVHDLGLFSFDTYPIDAVGHHTDDPEQMVDGFLAIIPCPEMAEALAEVQEVEP